MTKRLEELFNLPPKEQALDLKTVNEEIAAKAQEIQSVDQSFQAANDIAKSLPQIRELEELDDAELDGLADKAEQAYDDLMDLGMNVEVRYASRIFEVASSMLNNAISAKTAKIDKKLKAVDLQLKKLKIDNDTRGEDPHDVINGQGYVITDRNELLKKLGQKD
jgi:hypothetical protein